MQARLASTSAEDAKTEQDRVRTKHVKAKIRKQEEQLSEDEQVTLGGASGSDDDVSDAESESEAPPPKRRRAEPARAAEMDLEDLEAAALKILG